MIDKIKTMLAQITPGPWEMWERADSVQVIQKTGEWSIAEMDGGNYQMWQNNAEFIAASPEMLQWAVQEIERLQARMVESLVKDVPIEIHLLRSENARLRETLEWYAIAENHMDKFSEDDPFDVEVAPAQIDGGQRAREALKGSP